ncbi:MAG: putative glycoside hydrolase [bacterium]
METEVVGGTPEKQKRSFRELYRYFGALVCIVALGFFAYFISIGKVRGIFSASISESVKPVTTLMEMPKEVRAIYMTAPTAGSYKRVEELIAFAHAANMNAAVINVKDGDGIYLGDAMEALVNRLRKENIYPIARVVTFQDNFLVKIWPDLALKTASGTIWANRGYQWLDPASHDVWDYNTEVAIEALNEGFAEVNFDYIRFPSDGDLNGIVYPVYDGKKSKREVINEYSEFVTKNVKAVYPNAVISADIFAQGLISGDAQGIGQKFTDLASFYDVIAPMTYPSHYAPGNFGFQNPAEAPYEIIKGTLDSGNAKLKAVGKSVIVRPWLQDFNMGAVYDRSMIQKQISAVKDAGLTGGYMMWNPSNRYVLEKYK